MQTGPCGIHVKRSKSLQKLKNRIPGESEEDAKKTNLMRLLEDGEKMREVNVFLNVNEHLVSSIQMLDPSYLVLLFFPLKL
jgi:hypothetical protein